jgi:hypothetical protein
MTFSVGVLLYLLTMLCCWEHSYFVKEDYFGCMPTFGEKIYFGKDLILERVQQLEIKKHARKEGKQHARGKTTWRVGRQT